jgi:hypothetical protein
MGLVHFLSRIHSAKLTLSLGTVGGALVGSWFVPTKGLFVDVDITRARSHRLAIQELVVELGVISFTASSPRSFG